MTLLELRDALRRKPLGPKRYIKLARHVNSLAELEAVIDGLPEGEKDAARSIVRPLLQRKGAA